MPEVRSKANFKIIKRVSLTLFFCLVIGFASTTSSAENRPPVLKTIGNKNIFVPSTTQTSQKDAVAQKTAYIVSDSEVNREPSKDAPKFKPGEIIIKFKSDILEMMSGKRIVSASEIKTDMTSIQALNIKFGLLSIEKIYKKEDKNRLSARVRDLENTYLFRFTEDVDVETIVKEYKKDPNVEFVEPNYIMKIMELQKAHSKSIFFKNYK